MQSFGGDPTWTNNVWYLNSLCVCRIYNHRFRPIGKGHFNKIQLYYDVFSNLGLTDFTIFLNNRKILSSIFELVGEDEKLFDFINSLDKLDDIGVNVNIPIHINILDDFNIDINI